MVTWSRVTRHPGPVIIRDESDEADRARVSVSARVRFYHHRMAWAPCNGQPARQNLRNTRQISGHKTQAYLALGTDGCMF